MCWNKVGVKEDYISVSSDASMQKTAYTKGVNFNLRMQKELKNNLYITSVVLMAA